VHPSLAQGEAMSPSPDFLEGSFHKLGAGAGERRIGVCENRGQLSDRQGGRGDGSKQAGDEDLA
jgi:hypothetical protein